MSVYKKYNAIRNSISAKRWMLSTALTAVSMAAMAVPAQATDPTNSWVYDTASGNVGIDLPTAGITDIVVTGGNGHAEGNADIYTGHTVNVNGDSGATFSYEDNRANIQSSIDGDLISNMNIVIIDRNGVFFGNDSYVDVAGLITTSGHIDNDQLMNNDFGDYVIENVEGGGAIELNGVVNVSEAGLAAFVSPFVINNGVINAKMGNVVLASGEKVTLDLYGDGLLEVTVEGELSDALIKNKGTINAEGGIVQISALAAKDAVDNIINMDGVVNVSSVTQKGGKIILSGGSKGKVEVSGVLAASGKTDGGSVEVTGQNVDVTKDAVIVADAGENGDGGSAYFYGDDYTVFSGAFSARGGSVSGNGGNVEISAGNSVGYYGYTDLSAANGEIGTLLIDPEHLIISDAAFSGDSDFWSTFTVGGTVNINDQALADTLRVANINLWATETLSTGSDIDISEYNHYVSKIIGWNKVCFMGHCFRTTPIIKTLNFNGITGNDLTLAAPEVNLVHDITLGNGALNVADLTTADSVGGFGIVNPPHNIIVDHLNLDGRVYKRSNLGDASFTTLADDTQINTTANTINVLSNDASIQQAIQFADALDADAEDVNVAADTYKENLLVDRAVKLTGAAGATLQAASAGNLITVTAANVNIDPFVFDGLGIAANGIYANGANNLIVDGNSFTGFLLANVNVINSNNVRVKNNVMAGAEQGIFGDNVTNIHIFGNDIQDTTVAGIHVTNSPGSSYGGNDIDIWSNTVASTSGTGILVENSKYASIGDHPTNPFENGYGGANIVTGGDAGIVVSDSDYAHISHNIVDSVNGDAIAVLSSDNANVLMNKVGTTGGTNNIEGDGVFASDSNDLTIANNIITETHSTMNEKGSGVQVLFSDNVIIQLNDITNAGWDGIRVEGGDNVAIDNNSMVNSQRAGIYAGVMRNTTITENTVDGTNEFRGISVAGSNTVNVAANNVDNTKLDGIIANGVSGLTIDGNFVGKNGGNIGDDGIEVINSHGAQITGNQVNDTAANGIYNNGSNNTTISGNTITNVGLNGILVNPSAGVTVSGNTVTDSSEDGISIVDSQDVVVTLNTVDGTANGSRNDGISVEGSQNVVVSENTVRNSGWDGIYAGGSTGTQIIGNDVSNSDQVDITVLNGSVGTLVENNTTYNSQRGILVKTGSQDTTIRGNVVYNQTLDGIHVRGDKSVEVVGNYVGYTDKVGTVGADNNIASDGIFLIDADNAQVVGNQITQAGGNGIYLSSSDDAYIGSNNINDVGQNGIKINPSDHVEIAHNTIHDADWDGILVDDGHGADIHGNHVHRTGDDGIDVNNNSNVDIYSNTVKNAGDNGIEVSDSYNVDVIANSVRYSRGDGIELSRSSYADIRGNTVRHSGDDGIDVDRAYKVDVVDNHVHGARNNGIEVTNSYDADVIDNRVHYTGQDGIYVENSSHADIRYNDVHDTGDDGIDVRGGHGVDVVGNDTEDTGGDGIQVRYSNNVEIDYNTVLHAGDDGIDVENSDDAVISRNRVRFSKYNGIEVSDSDRTIIGFNGVRYSGDDGIDVEGGSDVLIVGNRSSYNGDDGIDVGDNEGGVYIFGNTARRNSDNGIDVNGAPHVEIRGNNASGNRSNGIYARNIHALTTLIVDGNTTRNNGEDGIKAYNLNTAYITNNTSYNNGDDGIDVDSAYHVEITGNDVYHNGYGKKKGPMPKVKGGYPGGYYGQGNGIEVSNIYGERTVIIDDNYVHNNAADGVNVENADRVIITDNEIFDNGDDGVDVNYANHVEILDNNIYGNGYGYRMPPMPMPSGVYQIKGGYPGDYYGYNEGHGIEVSNINSPCTLIIDGNNIHNNRVDGVNVDNARRVIITDNNIFRNGDDGVDINWADHVEIVDNNIYENGFGMPMYPMPQPVFLYDGEFEGPSDDFYRENGNGIEVTNIYGDKTLIIDDNNIYANRSNGIEASNVDSTFILNNNIYENGAHGLAMLGWGNGNVVVAGNDFTDNPIGALFESGYIDISNLQEPNTFTNTDPTATPVGMIFDGPSNFIVELSESSIKRKLIRGQLSIVGNTLGATKFSGFQNEGSFFVRIEDGTLLDGAGAPIVIDGLNAMFDGIRPSNTGGILSATDLGYIEDRLYDADDSPVNGRGQIFVGVEAEQLGNIEDFFRRFFGAPAAPGGLNVTIAGLPSVGQGAPNPVALNLIAPAAGGETPEDLANIEPAAGGEKVSCWGDAISAASGGATVNYSFGGGSFAEALADASACSVSGL